MTVTPRGVLLFGVLGALAAFTSWVLQISAPREVRERALRHEPDYHFGQPRITRFGADGRLELDLTAERAVHFPDDDSVALERLKVAVRAPDGAAWSLTAARGHGPMSSERFTLEGGVRIARPSAGAGAGVELATERVVLDTRAQRLETDAPVTLVNGANRISAVGLLAELDGDRITFKSRVRGTYAAR